jgi:hypothetical protein
MGHINALLMYCEINGHSCETRWGAGIDDTTRDYLPRVDANHQASSQQLLSRASEEGYRNYFGTYMDVDGGRDKYGDVPSPYDV